MNETNEAREADDEPIFLFAGFSEILISIGLIALMVALGLFNAYIMIAGALVASYFFVLKRRLTLPGIVLVLAIYVGCTLLFYFTQFESIDSFEDFQFFGVVLKSIVLSAILVAYYFFFRLPFALYPLAWSLFSVLGGLIMYYLIGDDIRLTESMNFSYSTIAFLSGLAAFIVAIWFDKKDLLRKTSDNQKAFWLHLFAAPMMLWPWVFRFMIEQTTSNAIIAAIGIFAMALIGLIIDRRSFVTIGILSFVTILSYFVDGFGKNVQMILFVVGGYALIMGAFWRGLRKAIFKLIPARFVGSFIPPLQ